MRRMLCLFVIIALSTCALWLGAEEKYDSQQEIEVEEEGQLVQEVFQSDLVYPQERGEVQITFVPQFSKGEEEKTFAFPVVLEYGITDAWQVEVAWTTFIHRNPDEGGNTEGIGDLEVGTAYSFVNIAESNFHFAVGFEMSFPIANIDKELTEGFIEYEPFVVFAFDLPEFNHLHLFLNTGFGFVQRVREPDDEEDEEEAAHEFFLNAGLVTPVGNQLRLSCEVNWSNNEWNHDGEENELFLTPGLVWNLPGTWELGVGVPIGLNNDSDDYRVLMVLTYEFNIFGDDDDD